jgi:hypothetical protein
MSALRTDLLEQAIGAARAGQRLTARGLLQAILADDPANVQAWLWYSGVVDEPAGQVAALERVLELDPSNARASYGLQWMREHHPEIWLPPPAPIPPPTPLEEREPVAAASAEPEEPEEPEGFDGSGLLAGEATASGNGSTDRLPVAVPVMISPLDEELRCPFCGALATADDVECPGCHRSLIVPEERRRGAGIARLVLAFLSLLVAVAAVGGSILLLQAAPQISALPLELVSGSGLGLLGLALLSFITMLGMLRRWRGIYVLDLVLTLAGAAGLVVLLAAGLNLFPNVLALPVVLGVGDMFRFTALIVAVLLLMALRLGLLVGARREFYPRRGRVRLSVQTLTGGEHFRLGGRYRDRGWYWAAARELERAVAEEPHKLKYRRLLAEAYAKIGDQARARDELRASVNLDPDTSPLARAGALAKDVQRERQ